MEPTDRFVRRTAIALLITVALVTVVAVSVLSASFNGGGTGVRVARAVRPEEGAPIVAPDDAALAWRQFASFIENQEQATGTSEPTIAPSMIDPDWANWREWKTKAQLGLNSGGESSCPPSASAPKSANVTNPATNQPHPFEFPPQFKNAASPSATPGTGQDCQSIIQTVRYNAIASKYIVDAHLSQRAQLDMLLANSGRVDFPLGSVIVKALWEVVDQSKIGNVVWDPGHPFRSDLDKSGFTFGPVSAGESGWPTRIKIIPTGSCKDDNYLVLGDIGASGGQSPTVEVPISCFWHSTDNKYVLVGLNIAHKISDQWLWFTFAWTNFASPPPSQSADANAFASRSFGLSGAKLSPMSHYWMNMTNAKSDPTGRKVCFDPYLEGAGHNGVLTNCVRCHQFATYVSQTGPSSKIAEIGGKPVNVGTDPNHGSSSTPIEHDKVQTYLKGTLATDSLWSIVTSLEQ